MPVPVLEREECNTDTPFGPFREKSAQRLIYTRKTSHLVSEFNFRHVLYTDYPKDFLATVIAIAKSSKPIKTLFLLCLRIQI